MTFLIPEARAQINNPALPSGIGSGPGEPIIGRTISALVGVFIVVGFVLAIFHFMFGAFRWITASGDKTALQNAQDRMTQAVVGLIILAAAWAVMLLVSEFLGLDFPNINLPGLTTTTAP